MANGVTAQKLVFLMGSGVVKNAWAPVIRALRTVYHPRVDSAELANSAMANLVFHLRWASHDHERHGGTDQEAADALASVQAKRAEVCEAIAKELQSAESNGELNVQDGFDFVWNRYVGAVPSFFLVTTNWDRVVDKRAERDFPNLANRILHVHGDHLDSDKLLLPSELAFESYYDDAARAEALTRHRQIMDAIDEADVLVIYGLSLSPLDAELSQLISTGIDESSTDKAVEIVDLAPDKVAKQLLCMLRTKTPVIRCWTPCQSIASPA